MQKAVGRSCKREAWYLQHVCPSVRLKWGWTKNRCPTYCHTTRDQNRSHSAIFSCGRPVGFQYATPLPSNHWSRAWLPTVDTRGCIQKVNQESTATCDPCRRTCGQYEGLGSPRREWGRGVVAVPTVWVKRVRGQMRSRVNNWLRGETRESVGSDEKRLLLWRWRAYYRIKE